MTAQFGFMELPDIPQILAECRKRKILDYGPKDISYFVSRLQPVATDRPGMALWREKLFVFMLRNATLAPDFFRIPADDIIELRMKLEI